MYSKLVSQLAGSSVGASAYNFFKILCEGEIVNEHYLSDLGGSSYIIAPNHVSHFDWMVLHYFFEKKLKQHLSFLAKKELFESKFWLPMMKYSNSIPVDRDNVSRELLKNIYKVIDEKKVLGIFPEGTRSSNGKLLQPKNGVVKIATSLKIPIVPIGLNGFFEVWPKNSNLPRPSKCKIVIGKPIAYDMIKDSTIEQNSFFFNE